MAQYEKSSNVYLSMYQKREKEGEKTKTKLLFILNVSKLSLSMRNALSFQGERGPRTRKSSRVNGKERERKKEKQKGETREKRSTYRQFIRRSNVTKEQKQHEVKVHQ